MKTRNFRFIIDLPKVKVYPHEGITFENKEAGYLYIQVKNIFWLRVEASNGRELEARLGLKKFNYVLSYDIFGFKVSELIRVAKFWKPVYCRVWSRDCDMCESTYYTKYKNYFEMFHSRKKAYEWAEGPMSYDEVSKQEYLEYKNTYHTRDRAMEAFENGNGRSIYV